MYCTRAVCLRALRRRGARGMGAGQRPARRGAPPARPRSLGLRARGVRSPRVAPRAPYGSSRAWLPRSPSSVPVLRTSADRSRTVVRSASYRTCAGANDRDACLTLNHPEGRMSREPRPRSPAGRETRVSHRAKCHGRSRGLLYGGPLRWASACARACPIADEENSQRPTFFLSMGGNLYFTCAAPRSAAVSCLRG